MKKNLILTLLLIITASAALSAQGTFRRGGTREYDIFFRFNVQPTEFSLDNMRIPNPQREFRITMREGQHTIRVTAPNHKPYQTTLNVNASLTLNIDLEPLLAQVKVDTTFLLQFIRPIPGRGNPPRRDNEVRVFLDGREVGTSFETEGRKRVRVEVGDLVIEDTYDFSPGRNYTLRPQFTMLLEQN